MADIDVSKIKLPGDNNDYVLKDADARSNKMDKVNPTGSGSLSINRNSSNSTGSKSVAVGDNATASGYASFAEGKDTTASGAESHAEGLETTASGSYAHAEGQHTTASHVAHAEGYYTTASGYAAHVEGERTTASADDSHAEGYFSTASGTQSHVEGRGTVANHRSQHVFGEWNVPDPSTASGSSKGTYIEIVGNGTGTTSSTAITSSDPSNARTLDWDGNEVLAGTIDAIGTGSTLKAAIRSDIRVELTQAEYDALEQAGTLDPNVMYIITDADPNFNGLVNLIYPIGSIYMSVNNVNPGTYLLGTTWVAWGAGKVPVGVDTSDTDFDTVEETGGTKSVTLTAAQSGVPEHIHATAPMWAAASGSGSNNVVTGYPTTGKAGSYHVNIVANTAQNASQAHTNLQPYITCYMWKRTA